MLANQAQRESFLQTEAEERWHLTPYLTGRKTVILGLPSFCFGGLTFGCTAWIGEVVATEQAEYVQWQLYQGRDGEGAYDVALISQSL
jgi:hypothetical protein